MLKDNGAHVFFRIQIQNDGAVMVECRKRGLVKLVVVERFRIYGIQVNVEPTQPHKEAMGCDGDFGIEEWQHIYVQTDGCRHSVGIRTPACKPCKECKPHQPVQPMDRMQLAGIDDGFLRPKQA